MIRFARRRPVVTALAMLGAVGVTVAVVLAAKVGDCNNDGTVSIGDVSKCGLIFAARTPLSNCTNCDQNANGSVSIGEVSQAGLCFSNANAANCKNVTPQPGGTTAVPTNTPTVVPTATPITTPSVTLNICGNGIPGETHADGFHEQCDDGGTCVAGPEFCQTGPNVGHPCHERTAEADCGADEHQFAFACYGIHCTADSQCGGGTCKPFGGDGCAANCTTETSRAFQTTGAFCTGGTHGGQQFDCTDVGNTGTTAASTAQCGFNGSCVGRGECTAGAADRLGHDCAVGPLVCLGGAVKGRACGTANFISNRNDCRVCTGGTRAGLPCDGLTTGTYACTGGSCPSLACNSSSGTKTGNPCASNANCTPGLCNTILVCNGGTSDGVACKTNAECGTGGICGPICGSQCGTGGACTNKSRAFLQSASLPISIGPLIARQTIITGNQNLDGTIPVAVPASSVRFEPIKVAGLACACVTGGSDPSVHGPGNSASGTIGCGAGGLDGINVDLTIDHNTSPPFKCTSGVTVGAACSDDNGCTTQGTCSGLQCVGGPTPGAACASDNNCGTGGACRGSCTAGPFIGQTCGNNSDCTSFGLCSTQGPGVCSATSGARAGNLCLHNTDCNPGTCDGALQGGGLCVTGPNKRKHCLSNTDCAGFLCNSPDDPTCTAADPLPERDRRLACLEKKEFCTAGSVAKGTPCHADNDCGIGGACGTACSAGSPHPGVCNSPIHISRHETGEKGSGIFANTTAIGVILDTGLCTTDLGNADKGPDGIPCTLDDPPTSRGTPQTLVTTTGTATAMVVDANAFTGSVITDGQCSATLTGTCQSSITGFRFDCTLLANNPTGGTSGARLASAFPAIETAQVGDNTVINIQSAK